MDKPAIKRCRKQNIFSDVFLADIDATVGVDAAVDSGSTNSAIGMARTFNFVAVNPTVSRDISVDVAVTSNGTVGIKPSQVAVPVNVDFSAQAGRDGARVYEERVTNNGHAAAFDFDGNIINHDSIFHGEQDFEARRLWGIRRFKDKLTTVVNRLGD